MTKPPHLGPEIFRAQFGNRLAQIVKKSFGSLQITDHAAGHYRQKGNDVVAAPALKFLRHFFRPVLAARFPTVHEKGMKHFARLRAGEFDHPLHHMIKVRLNAARV